MQATQHIIDNLLRHVYHTLKEKERYAKEGSSRTSYEVAMDTINDAFSPSAPLYRPTNSDVESFYRGTTTAEEFVWRMNDYIISKARDRLDGDLNPLLSISWDLYSSVQGRRDTCSNVQKLTGRRLWAVFNKLDTSRESLVDIDDITDVILKLYSSNSRQEDPENIQEWFCNMKQVDFWSFFSALVENHRDLIQGASAVQSLHKEVFHEILKEGKMTKKGHKIQTWKMRQFILTTTSLNYYDENLVLKGSVMINGSARVDQLPGVKGRSFLFRVTDGTNGTPYDIATHDSQSLKEWIDMLHVVIALHQEGGGRSYLHRMRLARARIFPNSKQTIPSSKSEGPSNSVPSSRVFHAASPPPRNAASPTPPPLFGQETSRETPPPAVSDGDIPIHRPNKGRHIPAYRRHSTEIMENFGSHSPSPTPLSPDDTLNYAELDYNQPPVPPIRQSSTQSPQHKPLRQVMSASGAPTTRSAVGASKPPPGYIQVNFAGPSPVIDNAPMKPIPTAKQRFGYSTVILPEVDVEKDVNKALELKQNKPHPGIPSRYGDSNNFSPTSSSSSLESAAVNEPPPVPAARKISPATKPRGVIVLPELPAQNNRKIGKSAIVDDETPPPLPNPRGRNNIASDDHVYVNVQANPPVPARSGRRADDPVPPVPPPRT